jgi:hypothetical protein
MNKTSRVVQSNLRLIYSKIRESSASLTNLFFVFISRLETAKSMLGKWEKKFQACQKEEASSINNIISDCYSLPFFTKEEKKSSHTEKELDKTVLIDSDTSKQISVKETNKTLRNTPENSQPQAITKEIYNLMPEKDASQADLKTKEKALDFQKTQDFLMHLITTFVIPTTQDTWEFEKEANTLNELLDSGIQFIAQSGIKIVLLQDIIFSIFHCSKKIDDKKPKIKFFNAERENTLNENLNLFVSILNKSNKIILEFI